MNDMNSKVLTRVIFGTIMIAVLAGLLYLDWRLDREYGRRQGLLAELTVSSEGIHFLGGERLPHWLPKLPTCVVLAIVVVLGFLEFGKLARSAGAKLIPVSGLLATVALATMPYWGVHLDARWPVGWTAGFHAKAVFLVLIALAAAFLEQMFRRRTDGAIRSIAMTVLAAVYLGLCGAFIFRIRTLGVAHLVLFLAAVKCTDIGAYFTGTAVGRHKLIRWLSPGKSWEGLAGGLIAAAGVSMLVTWLMDIRGLAVWEAAIFGVVVGAAGQFGDLCESLLKRSVEMKDSGAVVPEFGGVLDIIDSPLIAAPVALVLLTTMTG